MLFISGSLIGMFFIPANQPETSATALLTFMTACLDLLHQKRSHLSTTHNQKQRTELSER